PLQVRLIHALHPLDKGDSFGVLPDKGDHVLQELLPVLSCQLPAPVVSVIPEHPGILGAFNTTIDPLPDGSRINFYIYANDTLGRTFAAGNYNFDVKLDIYEPVILLKTTYPSDEVIAGDEVFIEFKIFEFPIHSAIISCQLFWRLNDGDYAPKNMTWYDIDGQYMLWLVDLGSFSVGDVISFYCIAVDESLNVGQSAFYRLTIISGIQLTPFATWQTLAAVGLVAAPGIGYGLTRIHRGRSMTAQRELKKEARKRSTRKRPRRSRRN
ncbi:MAG: hypothetical protein ACFFAY_14710, partial [Promethearchaeota archaeon]